jgi:AcrR family transcriptional regulator
MSQRRGRTSQKARTRAAIVEAARLLASPNIEQAADAAGVSRATAYRYFPTQEALAVELVARTIVAPIERAIDEFHSTDVNARLETVIDAWGDLTTREETHMRTALRVYQDTWLKSQRKGEAPRVRRGQRMEWIDKVLEPLPKLPADQLARLRAALALTIGADSMFILKDVVGLSHDDALAVLRWAGSAMLGAALGEAGVTQKAAASGRGSVGTRRKGAPRSG